MKFSCLTWVRQWIRISTDDVTSLKNFLIMKMSFFSSYCLSPQIFQCFKTENHYIFIINNVHISHPSQFIISSLFLHRPNAFHCITSKAFRSLFKVCRSTLLVAKQLLWSPYMHISTHARIISDHLYTSLLKAKENILWAAFSTISETMENTVSFPHNPLTKSCPHCRCDQVWRKCWNLYLPVRIELFSFILHSF